MFLNRDRNSRTSIVLMNILSSFGIKGMSILISFLLIPLTINYISAELYGIWLTLISIIHWASLFDLGLGNGLRNMLAESLATEDYTRAKKLVSTAYVFIGIIFFALAILTYLGAGFIHWSSFLNVSEALNETIIVTVRVVFVCFCLQMILKIINSVALAFQQTALSGLIDLVGQLISLLAIFICTKFIAPSLPILGLALTFSPLLSCFVFSIFLFRSSYRNVAPSLSHISLLEGKRIFNLGWQFFVLQIAYIIIYQTTNILLSRYAGAQSVTEYNIAFKYFNCVPMLVAIIIAPFWTAFTDAYTRKDIKWMCNVYAKLRLLALGAFFFIGIMLAVSPFFYSIWIGDSVSISFSMSIIVALYNFVLVWCNIHSSLINGIGNIKLSLILSIFSSITYIPLALLLSDRFGVIGIISAGIIVNLPWSIFGPRQIKELIGIAK